MFYTIYETTNVCNGKKYIGKHITKDLSDGYMGSGIYLKKAIKKYGKDNFIKKTLFVYDNVEDMNQKESELVNEELIVDSEYYNISLGGYGGVTVLYKDHHLYEEYCAKISNAQQNRSQEMSSIVKELHKHKKVGMYGKKQSDHQKEVMRKLFTGMPKNEESVKKQKESLIETLSDVNYIHPNTGRVANEETLKKMSLATKNRPKKTCEHCNIKIDPANFSRYHGDKCKHKLKYEDLE